jgi:hypothetical protein
MLLIDGQFLLASLPVGLDGADAIFDHCQCPFEFLLQFAENVEGLIIGSATDGLCTPLGLPADRCGALLGGMSDDVFCCELGCLAACQRDDAFRLLVGLSYSPVFLTDDPLGAPHLVGDRDAHLIEQGPDTAFVHPSNATEGQPLAPFDDLFQAVYQV